MNCILFVGDKLQIMKHLRTLLVILLRPTELDNHSKRTPAHPLNCYWFLFIFQVKSLKTMRKSWIKLYFHDICIFIDRLFIWNWSDKQLPPIFIAWLRVYFFSCISNNHTHLDPLILLIFKKLLSYFNLIPKRCLQILPQLPLSSDVLLHKTISAQRASKVIAEGDDFIKTAVAKKMFACS